MLVQQAKFDPAVTSSGIQETNSPVFASLIEIMGKEHKWGILDLGSARSANLEKLSKFRCRLFIEDAQELASALSGRAAEDQAALVHWFEQWAGGVSDESIDVVIAWDIFNYLDPELCKVFVELLSRLLKPGAYIYLLAYSQKEMPELPTRFTIVADDRLEYQPLSKATRPSPRFNQTDLKKRLPQFSIVKSVLLRNGMQEYLFKRIP